MVSKAIRQGLRLAHWIQQHGGQAQCLLLDPSLTFQISHSFPIEEEYSGAKQII